MARRVPFSTNSVTTHYSSDEEYTLSGAVLHTVHPAPSLTNAQAAGITLSQQLRNRLLTLVAGPPSLAMTPFWYRRDAMLETGGEILNESLPRLIEETFEALELPVERLVECQTFFTLEGQRSLYYDRFNIAATIGQEVDLEDIMLEGIDVLKLIYAVCSGHPDATQQLDNFFKSVFMTEIPRYFEHPLRPPPKHMTVKETWGPSSPDMPNNSGCSSSVVARDSYARLLIIAKDWGMEIDASASRKHKGKKWVCKMTMYRVVAGDEEGGTMKIPIQMGRGVGGTSNAARQAAASEIINRFSHIN
ncbi:hypothetical protein TWF481_010934 [Arthrobotrys musiformis]|uniref:DRBM domain-containing protein n=1 Tax=Arthrobotrys musiformis TaxID=47236 RepID=A0AAV9VYT2_9PEZI